jgi:hypothetical protein
MKTSVKILVGLIIQAGLCFNVSNVQAQTNPVHCGVTVDLYYKNTTSNSTEVLVGSQTPDANGIVTFNNLPIKTTGGYLFRNHALVGQYPPNKAVMWKSAITGSIYKSISKKSITAEIACLYLSNNALFSMNATEKQLISTAIKTELSPDKIVLTAQPQYVPADCSKGVAIASQDNQPDQNGFINLSKIYTYYRGNDGLCQFVFGRMPDEPGALNPKVFVFYKLDQSIGHVDPNSVPYVYDFATSMRVNLTLLKDTATGKYVFIPN